jgi:oligopeptidase A
MLTTVPYSEIAGQRNVEWDSLQTCAMLMSMLLLEKPTLQSLGRHYQTGQPLPEATIDAALKCRSSRILLCLNNYVTERVMYLMTHE